MKKNPEKKETYSELEVCMEAYLKIGKKIDEKWLEQKVRALKRDDRADPGRSSSLSPKDHCRESTND